MTERIHGIEPDYTLRIMYLNYPLARSASQVPHLGPEQPFIAEADSLELWNAIFGD